MIDWCGQGDSAATSGGYDMESLTADAVALIRELGAAPMHWVGLSMGGFVGQRIAARHGELLRSLTLLNTSAAAEEPGKASEYKRLALFQRLFGIKPIAGTVKSHLFGPAFLADPASKVLVDEWARRLGRSDRAAIRKAVLGVADREPVDGELSEIDVPTLVVAPPTTGRRHRFTRSVSPPGYRARLGIVADCGHTSTLERPEIITGLLGAFLAAVDEG
jgi:3-oxoadipate enol-lactonase